MEFENMLFVPEKPPSQVTRLNQAWAVDFALLDFPARPFVMLVVDVCTRRPLSATVSLMLVEDIIVRLERLAKRSRHPEQVRMGYSRGYNTIEGHFYPPLQEWAQQHRISLAHDRMLLRRISERPLRNLSAFLRKRSFTTLLELGHEIERWRQSYSKAANYDAT